MTKLILGIIMSMFLVGCGDQDDVVLRTQPTPGEDGLNGNDGKDGKDALITVTQTANGAEISSSDGSVATVLNGSQGPRGEAGAKGATGAQGIQGKQGIQGVRGYTGATGPQGIQGKDGKDGKDGVNGINGTNGVNGSNGVDGKDGKDGAFADVKIYEAYRSVNHVIWFPSYVKIDRLFRFEEGMNGYYTEYPNGTAKLTGTVRGTVDNGQGFRIEAIFKQRTYTAPSGSPKYGNNTGADASSWHYYEMTSAFLIGTGKLVGLKLKITRRGPAFQVGTGANYHDMDFGASGWFYYEVLQQAKCKDYVIYEDNLNNQYGDFNLDLVEIK